MDVIAHYNVVETGVQLTTDRQRALLVFTTFQGQVGIAMTRSDLASLGEQIATELARRAPPGR